MTKLLVVDRDGEEHEVECKPGLKIMETLRELDYGVAAICGGMCSCATCHVYVEGGWFDRLPPMSELEQEMVALACDPKPNSRLACQIKIDDGLEGLIVWTPVRQ